MEIESGRLKFNQGGENYIKNAIFLGSHPNYGHWLFNHLGRLKYIKKITKDTQVIVQGTASQNQIDLLTYFGIEPANIHRTKTGITLNVGHLIIPQIPWHRLDGSGVWWSPSAISYLSEQIRSNRNANRSSKRRVFITRQNTLWRRVLNEEELFQVAMTLGFELIDIGQMRTDEQIKLGQQTEVLISPLGANSNFFSFMPRSSHMIELAPPMNCMNVTGTFCNAAGISYHQLIGTPVQSNTNQSIDADYYINKHSFWIT